MKFALLPHEENFPLPNSGFDLPHILPSGKYPVSIRSFRNFSHDKRFDLPGQTRQNHSIPLKSISRSLNLSDLNLNFLELLSFPRTTRPDRTGVAQAFSLSSPSLSPLLSTSSPSSSSCLAFSFLVESLMEAKLPT